MAKEIKREIVKASDAKKVERAEREEREVREEKSERAEKSNKEKNGGSAVGKRIAAIVFWLLAIAAEAAVIMLLNGYLYLPYDLKTMLIAGIVIDLIFVIVGSQFWKKANRVNPPSEKNKVWFFLCSQMGLIVAVIAFCPLIVLLLKNKDLDKKTKRIVSIIAAIALIIAGACSIDYDPVSQEDLAEAKQELGDGDVYWTRYGRSYHLDQDCHTLSRSSVIYEGTLDEAFDAKRNDPCDFCAEGGVEGGEDDALDAVGDVVEQIVGGDKTGETSEAAEIDGGTLDQTPIEDVSDVAD